MELAAVASVLPFARVDPLMYRYWSPPVSPLRLPDIHQRKGGYFPPAHFPGVLEPQLLYDLPCSFPASLIMPQVSSSVFYLHGDELDDPFRRVNPAQQAALP